MSDDHVYLAAFCHALPKMRVVLRQQGRSEELRAAVEAVRDGTPVLEVLPGLGIAPHVLAGAGAGRGGNDILNPLRRAASGEVYRCPDGSCGWEAVREPGGPIPRDRCWLRDLPTAVGEA
ncbi:hypothetical protein [Saccharothrix xinjiangensis]|uniref:Uncharacterized protein n=1 Tax=Saccharothrix xinjiangensis TaxID=204798 RepID=A0ABV9YFH9_9PSEU